MIYIPKKITPRLLRSILNAALELGASRFVIWFYPETSERQRARLLARFQYFQTGRDALEVRYRAAYGRHKKNGVHSTPYEMLLSVLVGLAYQSLRESR